MEGAGWEKEALVPLFARPKSEKCRKLTETLATQGMYHVTFYLFIFGQKHITQGKKRT